MCLPDSFCTCDNSGMEIDRARLRRAMQKLVGQKNKQWADESLKSLGEILSVNVVVKPPISELRTATDHELPAAVKYLRRIGVCALLMGVARLTPPSLYWFQMGFIWLAGVAFILDACFERWRWSTKFAVGVLIVVLEIGYSLANGVLEKVPTIEGVVSGLRATSGNAAGCTIYNVSIPVQTDLDRLSFKLQFPMDVAGFKVGTASESQAASMTVSEIGSTPDGECQLVQSVAVDTPGVNAVLAGPGIVRLNSRDVSNGVTITGIFVLSKTKRSFSPPVKFSAEGSYAFNQRGRGLMSKPLSFIDNGVQDTK